MNTEFEDPTVESTGTESPQEPRQREKEQQQEALYQEQLNVFDQRIATLASTIKKNQERPTDAYPIHSILIESLDIALMLRKLADLTAFTETIASGISDATDFIVSLMKFSDEIETQMNTTEYGLFAKIKQRHAIRKTIRRNIKRTKAFALRVERMKKPFEAIAREFSAISTGTNKSKKKTVPGGSTDPFPLATRYLYGDTSAIPSVSEADTPLYAPETTSTSDEPPQTSGYDDIL